MLYHLRWYCKQQTEAKLSTGLRLLCEENGDRHISVTVQSWSEVKSSRSVLE